MQPFVSVVTPTRNRRRFIPNLIDTFLRQTWPADRLELIVLDDGPRRVADLIPDDPRIRYVASDMREALGTKRNRCAELARGEIIVHMDDDDYYPDDRVEAAVRTLQESGKPMAGKSEVVALDMGTGRLHQYPKVNNQHVRACTLAYTREYWQKHPFAPVPHDEERAFTQNFLNPLAQIPGPTWQVVMCTWHGRNTLKANPGLPEADVTLEQIIPDPERRAFYTTPAP